jgi:hypothetical protein
MIRESIESLKGATALTYRILSDTVGLCDNVSTVKVQRNTVDATAMRGICFIRMGKAARKGQTTPNASTTFADAAVTFKTFPHKATSARCEVNPCEIVFLFRFDGYQDNVAGFARAGILTQFGNRFLVGLISTALFRSSDWVLCIFPPCQSTARRFVCNAEGNQFTAFLSVSSGVTSRPVEVVITFVAPHFFKLDRYCTVRNHHNSSVLHNFLRAVLSSIVDFQDVDANGPR